MSYNINVYLIEEWINKLSVDEIIRTVVFDCTFEHWSIGIVVYYQTPYKGKAHPLLWLHGKKESRYFVWLFLFFWHHAWPKMKSNAKFSSYFKCETLRQRNCKKNHRIESMYTPKIYSFIKGLWNETRACMIT